MAQPTVSPPELRSAAIGRRRTLSEASLWLDQDELGELSWDGDCVEVPAVGNAA
jgi:hypothetical protein